MTTKTPPGELGVLRWSLGHANSMEGPGKPSGELPGQKSKITKNGKISIKYGKNSIFRVFFLEKIYTSKKYETI